MPIHTTWKSMVKGMKNTYCKKGDKTKCRPFTDGTKVCLCTKAWSVFFATMRKRGWDEGSPRSKKVSETVFNEAIEEIMAGFIIWYEEALGPEDFKDMTLEEMVDKLREWENEREELGYKSPPITEKESKDIELASNINSLKYCIGERIAQKQKEELIKWYEGKIGIPKRDGSGKGVGANKGRGGCPKWVQMARRFLASKKGNPKLRAYWKNRLLKYEASRK